MSNRPDKQFYHELNIELLKSERARVLVVIGILIVAVFLFPMSYYQLQPYLHDLTLYYFSAWLIVFLLFEIVVWVRISYFIRNKYELPETIKAISVMIEMSFPCVLMILLTESEKTHIILNTNAPMMYFVLICLSALHLDFRLSVLAGLLAATGYVISLWWMGEHTASFRQLGFEDRAMYYSRAWLMVVNGLCAGFVAAEIKKRIRVAIDHLQKRQQVEDLLGQQVSREIARELVEERQEALGRQIEASIMFLDIENFTEYADRSTPVEVIAFQNHIFCPLIEIVAQHEGIINQFMGDGFMATFGAPISNEQHACNALQAGMAIIEKMQWLSRQQIIPPTRVRIGLHTGEIVTGNIGNETRRQYSISGSAVIIAARLEQLNKIFGSQLLVSGELYQKADTPCAYAENKGEMRLKGLNRCIEVIKIK